jgi:hypothetical protein
VVSAAKIVELLSAGGSRSLETLHARRRVLVVAFFQ